MPKKTAGLDVIEELKHELGEILVKVTVNRSCPLLILSSCTNKTKDSEKHTA
jgi:hypothetical protein